MRSRAALAASRGGRRAALALRRGAGLRAARRRLRRRHAVRTPSEKTGTYAMQVVHAQLPAAQSIARQTRLVLPVHNSGTATVPNVAVTIDSFDYASNYPELAADKRPVWVIERGPGAIAKPPVESEEVSPPGGGQTAYVNTWALGPLAPGATRMFVWQVVPVKPAATPSPTPSPRASPARPRPAVLGRSGSGTVRGRHRPGPAAHPREPGTGRLEVGEARRRLEVGQAPQARRRRRRSRARRRRRGAGEPTPGGAAVWPGVEISAPPISPSR